MFKKKINPFILYSSLLTIAFVIYIFFQFNKENNVVFVDNAKVFNEFKMTKELIKNGEKELQKKKARLDSLYAYLNIEFDQDTKAKLMQEIINQKTLIEEFQSNYSSSNSKKIWERINSYVKDYSTQKGYNLIQGSQTNNTVFYYNPDLDVTADVLNYINKRYEGFN